MENLKIRNIIREQLYLVGENKQLADKVYFSPGKLSEKVKEIILSKITHGDAYTKIITDIYWAYLQQSVKTGKWALAVLDGKGLPEDDDIEEETPENDVLDLETWKKIKELYEEIKNYNKNVFPIQGYDINKPKDIWGFIMGLEERKKIIDNFNNKMPSVASRNMKDDIREERHYWELKDYREKLDYFLAHYSLLGNRDDVLKDKIIKKMFKSNITLQELLRFAEEKQNLLGGMEFTKEKVRELEQTSDIQVVYDKDNIMIVNVFSPLGIKAIGCNSLWCFTYGSGFDIAYRQWGNYSYNDQVYVIIDFSKKSDDQEFMFVLIKPLVDEDGKFRVYAEDDDSNIPLFNMANENYYDPYLVLKDLLGKDYKKIIKNIMNFNY